MQDQTRSWGLSTSNQVLVARCSTDLRGVCLFGWPAGERDENSQEKNSAEDDSTLMRGAAGRLANQRHGGDDIHHVRTSPELDS